MWKLAFIIVSLQMYLIQVLQKCSLSSPLPNMYMNFFQTAEFDWFRGLVAMATKMLNLRKNIKKIISSEAIRGMKLKLYRNVHNMCLYKKNVFLLHLLMCICLYGNLTVP